jgi:hypothetical protein
MRVHPLEDRIKIGVSTCLLGEDVRWNGGHARDRYLTDTLGLYVEFVSEILTFNESPEILSRAESSGKELDY